jgi:hypothetical protein
MLRSRRMFALVLGVRVAHGFWPSGSFQNVASSLCGTAKAFLRSIPERRAYMEHGVRERGSIFRNHGGPRLLQTND